MVHVKPASDKIAEATGGRIIETVWGVTTRLKTNNKKFFTFEKS